MSQLEATLAEDGYDGTKFSGPDDPFPDIDDIDWVAVERAMTNQFVQSEIQSDLSNRFVRVAGFLSGKTDLSLELFTDNCREQWCQIEITTTDSTKRFFVPRQIFDSLSAFALIRIAGRWCSINGDYYLIGTVSVR
jgi:hypothetical protein